MYPAELFGNIPIRQVLSCGDVANEAVLWERPFRGIACHSRGVRPGDLFVCIGGTHTDGHLYTAEAVRRGAALIVAERAVEADVPVVIVDDTRAAAAHMWYAYRGRPAEGMTLAAVTGTNGKTTVCHMLRHILRGVGMRVGIIGTVGCMAEDEEIPVGGGSELMDPGAAMTTPDPRYLYGTLERMRRAGVGYVVLEASSHAIYQKKLAPLAFHTAVFTGLSEEHLDFHPTMEDYYLAKAALFHLAERGVICTDTLYGERLFREGRCPSVSFGMSGEYFPQDVRQERGVTYYTLSHKGESAAVRCKMPGIIGVLDSMGAIAAAEQLGVPLCEAARQLSDFSGVVGRMEVLFDGDVRVIRDFAHTPAALRLAAETARRDTRGRLWLVFGCGGDRDREKRPLMGRAAAETADVTVVTSDNSRGEDRDAIIREIVRGIPQGREYLLIPDRETAIRYAVEAAEEGDTVLLCGKGHENYEITSKGRFPFDEAGITAAALTDRRRRKDV